MTRINLIPTSKISNSIPSASPSSDKVTSEYAVAQYVQAAQNPVVAGTGLVKDVSTNTLNHSNSITAMGTSKSGRLTYDAQGHILTFTPEDYVLKDHSGDQVLYAANVTGGVIDYSVFADPSVIVQRDYNGQIEIPLTPTENQHAASKKYIDDIAAVLAAIVSVTVVDAQPASPVLNTMYYIGTAAPYQIKLYANDSAGSPIWYDMGTTELDLTNFIKREDIVDALDSTATDKPLSAKQGKILEEKKVDVGNVTHMKMWKGTQAEYDAIPTKDEATMYMITDSAGESGALTFDKLWPINSIYLCMSPVLPPAFSADGRAWVKIGNGKFLMATDGSTIPVGTSGGSNSRVLTVAQLPAHSHGFAGNTGENNVGHTHTKGTMRIKGSISNVASKTRHGPSSSGCLDWDNNGDCELGGASHSFGEIILDTDDGGWSGKTSNESAGHIHGFGGTTGNTGSGQAIDTTPAYLAVTMWQRVA